MGLKWKALLVVVVGAVLMQFWLALFPSLTGWGSVAQPIAFNHKKHTAELSLPCTACHHRAEKDAVAGRPLIALCLGCHSGGETNNPEIKKLLAFGAKGEEVPWRRVWRLPSHIYFPHRVHVTAAKIACQNCHGPMETLERPPERALKTLTMDECMACHDKRVKVGKNEGKDAHPVKITARQTLNDCLTCHR